MLQRALENSKAVEVNLGNELSELTEYVQTATEESLAGRREVENVETTC